jgi:Superfamily II DNA/RNA helicases, SNF2 family
VLKELPPRQETLLHCEMGPRQRKCYTELRDHYRDKLLHRIDSEGLAKSKMHVLEALLRLRQVACHPGLLDAQRASQPSAKFDALLPRLEEVKESGRKALVFSQFTSLLAILKDRLDAEGIHYAYLDGKSRKRDRIVESFQEDADLPLFLISLKAGGVGLNLTAADHVFLLDPWWNPAVERQAVDRTHRIGQTKVVNVYRLVTTDTVEERILELQDRKRELAEAIVGSDSGLLNRLTRDDLAALLGG